MATILDPFIPDSSHMRSAVLGLVSAVDVEASSTGKVILLSTNGTTRTFQINVMPTLDGDTAGPSRR